MSRFKSWEELGPSGRYSAYRAGDPRVPPGWTPYNGRPVGRPKKSVTPSLDENVPFGDHSRWRPLPPEEKARRQAEEADKEEAKRQKFIKQELTKPEPKRIRVYQNPEAVVVDIAVIRCDLTEKELWLLLERGWTASGISPKRVQFRAGNRLITEIDNPVYQEGPLPEVVWI